MNIRFKDVATHRLLPVIVPAPKGKNFQLLFNGYPTDLDYIEFTRHELDRIVETVAGFPK